MSMILYGAVHNPRCKLVSYPNKKQELNQIAEDLSSSLSGHGNGKKILRHGEYVINQCKKN